MNRVLTKISIFMILMIATISTATPTHWRLISPGIEYVQLSKISGFHKGYIHAFRVDLAQYKFEIAMASDYSNRIATVDNLTTASGGIIGSNGGFFSQELKSLGLRVSDNKIKSILKPTPWWSIFYIENNQPYIVGRKQFHFDKRIEFAIQSGPRLIINGQIPNTLKSGIDSRTAIGITREKKVILLVTDNLNLSTTALAKIMQGSQIEGGLDCYNALNLDGGSSTQLYAKTDKFLLQVPGFSAVTDAIVIIPRINKGIK